MVLNWINQEAALRSKTASIVNHFSFAGITQIKLSGCVLRRCDKKLMQRHSLNDQQLNSVKKNAKGTGIQHLLYIAFLPCQCGIFLTVWLWGDFFYS
jgi:hypothetical protein